MPSKTIVKKARAKPASDHVSYQDMITDAIITLKERNGSSRFALKKYVKANNKKVVDGKMFDSLFNRALKSGVEKGLYTQPKGSSGATKLAKKEPKSAASKIAAKATEEEKEKEEKKQEKEEKKKKEEEEKKPVEKKTAGKKAAAPKKPATQAQPEVAPKARATKTKAKATTKVVASPTEPAPQEASPIINRTKSGRVVKSTQKPPVTTAAAAPKKGGAKTKA